MLNGLVKIADAGSYSVVVVLLLLFCFASSSIFFTSGKFDLSVSWEMMTLRTDIHHQQHLNLHEDDPQATQNEIERLKNQPVLQRLPCYIYTINGISKTFSLHNRVIKH